MISNSILSQQKQRITSIDALRAFTLLGILIVHANNGFGFPYERIQSSFCDYLLIKLNYFFLESKCNTIFSVLFGVSFYLILRNPKNTNAKFVWRCFLLALIGLFNKLFYSYDVLMWYGLWGMVLVFFRNLKPKYLITSCISLVLISLFLARFRIGDLLFGPLTSARYGADKSFLDVISYPNAVTDYLRVLFNGGIFTTIAMFIFGYWIAKIGFIENIKQKLSKRYLVLIWSVFILMFIIHYIFYLKDIDNHSIETLNNYSASLAYASALLYLYYHSGLCNRILRLFEPYGKLGLTNYSIGGILGVVFINEFGLGLYKYSVTSIVVFFTMFFLLQAIFSFYWLRYFTYGPMEYIWRVATEKKMIPFKR